MSSFRTIYTSIILALAITAADAQDVVLEKIQKGDKVVVLAENKSKKLQLVTLDVTLENVVPDKTLPLETIIKPGEKKELVVLSPIPLKAWSYKTQYSFVEYIPETETTKVDEGGHVDYYLLPPENADDAPMPAMYARRMTHAQPDAQTTESQLPESELILFGQAGCPRCAMTRDYLSKHGIPYKELSITGNDENQELMNKYLFDSGFEGGKFMMPVVIVDGETHYSIKDITGFLEGLGSDK